MSADVSLFLTIGVVSEGNTSCPGSFLVCYRWVSARGSGSGSGLSCPHGRGLVLTGAELPSSQPIMTACRFY